jgi:hypothetical protein
VNLIIALVLTGIVLCGVTACEFDKNLQLLANILRRRRTTASILTASIFARNSI